MRNGARLMARTIAQPQEGQIIHQNVSSWLLLHICPVLRYRCSLNSRLSCSSIHTSKILRLVALTRQLLLVLISLRLFLFDSRITASGSPLAKVITGNKSFLVKSLSPSIYMPTAKIAHTLSPSQRSISTQPTLANHGSLSTLEPHQMALA